MTIDATAARLAALLTGAGTTLSDSTGGDLQFEPEVRIAALRRGAAPTDCWAVDGGQALVADARSVAVYATRAATVRWRGGACVVEDEGELVTHLLGCGEEQAALEALCSPVDPRAAVDVNLLREWGEWRAVAAALEAADPGAMVLVDGDLQPDWRIPSAWLAELLDRAAGRGVVLAAVTKHSSLARGSAPLVGQLEAEAEATFGERAMWWGRVARTRPDVGDGLQVVVARLDPDARFAFRVDLPGSVDPVSSLGQLSALCDDAAFPGYPYPLTVADRLAACPGWVRSDLWDRIVEHLERAGVTAERRERAFADRHRLMERS